MAELILVLGESGSGKSSGIRNLPPAETRIIMPKFKRIPIENSEQNYSRVSKKNPNGRIIVTDKLATAARTLDHISKNVSEVKYVVVDDNQYFSLFNFISKINEKSFDKFNEIAANMVDFIRFCDDLRDDLFIFITNHVETGEDVNGNPIIQAKTMGKFVKEKVTYEGLFTNVLLCDKEEGDDEDQLNHFFWTRKIGSTVKTAYGMFKDQKIPNDFKLVADRMREFYGIK